jgi:uncharacterized protein YggE
MRFDFLLAGAAALTLPVAAAAQVAPAAQSVVDGTLLEVSATGRVSRAPDQAVIRAGVVTQAATAAAATQENAARMAQVIASLKSAGIQPRDLSTSNVSLQPQYRYADNQPPVMFRVRAMAAESNAATQVLPGETDVTATINVRFVLK